MKQIMAIQQLEYDKGFIVSFRPQDGKIQVQNYEQLETLVCQAFSAHFIQGDDQ